MVICRVSVVAMDLRAEVCVDGSLVAECAHGCAGSQATKNLALAVECGTLIALAVHVAVPRRLAAGVARDAVHGIFAQHADVRRFGLRLRSYRASAEERLEKGEWIFQFHGLKFAA
jgi:hypothetical protein